jgi:hypothetical protein
MVSNTPGSVVAVTSGGITINLLFDAAAMTGSRKFPSGHTAGRNNVDGGDFGSDYRQLKS